MTHVSGGHRWAQASHLFALLGGRCVKVFGWHTLSTLNHMKWTSKLDAVERPRHATPRPVPQSQSATDRGEHTGIPPPAARLASQLWCTPDQPCRE